MKTKLNVMVGVLIVSVLIGGAFWHSRPDNTRAEKVTIAYLPVVQSLPLYWAIDRGYFAQENIAVQAVKFEAPNQIVDALLSGQADVAIAVGSGIVAVSQEKKPGTVTAFAFDGSTSGTINDVLVARVGSNLRAVGDLKGKKLGRIPGIQFQTITREILQRNGLGANDVEVVEIAPSLQVTALAAGQVDAVLGLEPLQTIALDQGIGVSLVENPMVKFVADPWWGGVSAITTQFLRERPATAKQVIDILIKAQEEVGRRPDEARAHLPAYTALDERLAKIVPFAIAKTYRSFSDDDVVALQKFVDLFKKHGAIENPFDVRTMLYHDSGVDDRS